MATPSASRTAQATGKGVDTTTSGIEGAWTPTPITWDNSYFDTLFGWEWELTESPAGAKQWKPSNPEAQDIVPDAHDPSRRHAPMMTTADMALRMDPVYEPISRHFHENPAESPTPMPVRGSSCCTATWVPCRAISAPKFPPRN